MRQTTYHGYQSEGTGTRANAALWRKQVRRGEHRAGEATKLRRQAQEMSESIFDLTCTANRIGEADGWKGTRYEAVSATLRQMRACWQALIARANAMERPGA
jgi:hypothetical protein